MVHTRVFDEKTMVYHATLFSMAVLETQENKLVAQNKNYLIKIKNKNKNFGPLKFLS